jgi:hypothetical protein
MRFRHAPSVSTPPQAIPATTRTTVALRQVAAALGLLRLGFVLRLRFADRAIDDKHPHHQLRIDRRLD